MNKRGLACIVVLATAVVLLYLAQTEEPEKTEEVALVADSPATIPNVLKPILEDIGIDGKASILGHVFDAASGLPIATFEVALGSEGKTDDTTNLESPTQYAFESVTDPEGIFKLEDIDVTETEVIVRAAGYALSRQNVNITPGELTEIEVFLEPELAVRGRVFDPDGKPIKRAQIFIGDPPRNMSVRFGHASAAATVSNSDGSYALDHLPTSATRISAFSPDYHVKSIDFSGIPGTVNEVDIHLSAGGIVQGVVRFAGKRVQGQHVTLANSKSGVITMRTKTDDSGNYRFAGLAAGEWSLDAQIRFEGDSAERYSLRRSVSIELNSVLNEDFALGESTASVEGYIVGIEGSVDSSMVKVSWTNTEGRTKFTYDFVNADGYFRIDYLPQGPATISTNVLSLNSPSRVLSDNIHLVEGRAIRHDLDFTTRAIIRGQLKFRRGEVFVVSAYPGRHVATEDKRVPTELLQSTPRHRLSRGITEPGTYKFHISDPGVYTVFAWSRILGFSGPPVIASSVVTVKEGDDIVLDFELD